MEPDEESENVCDNDGTPSLQLLAATTVGRRPDVCLANNGMKLADVPTPLVERILPWISAYRLLNLDTSGLEQRGFDVDDIWRTHATARWLHKKPSELNPFRIGQIPYRQFYIDEHFRECLNILSHNYMKWLPSLNENPQHIFMLPLTSVPKHRFEPGEEGYSNKVDMDHLMELVPHVRTLSIQYKQTNFLEENPELLHELVHSIDTLHLQNLATRGTLTTINRFVVYGRIKYLTVTNCIWDAAMMDMLTVMSGHGQGQISDDEEIDDEVSVELMKMEKVLSTCKQCENRRKLTKRTKYQVPNLFVENQTIHPINDARFIQALRTWTGLEEFIHVCSPLTTPKVDEDTVTPLVDAVSYLVRHGQLRRFHLNGPYHMSIINVLTEVTAARNVNHVSDITFSPLIHCHMTCQIGKGVVVKKARAKTPSKGGIVSLELNSVFCDHLLRPVLFKPIIDIVSSDESLQHLTMQSCRQFPVTLGQLFRAIGKGKRLVSLDISGNYIQRCGFCDLLTMIKHCDSLRTLVIDYCELPTREIYIQELAQIVAQSNLTTLSVANNRLGRPAAQLVVDILRIRNGQKLAMQSINISQNCLRFEDVANMCEQLLSLRKELLESDYLVMNLSVDDVVDCASEKLAPLWDELSRLNVVKNVVSRNNLLQVSRATMLGYVAQM